MSDDENDGTEQLYRRVASLLAWLSSAATVLCR